MASSIAFFCAEEPSAFRVPPPVGQSEAAVVLDEALPEELLDALPEPPALEPALLSEPHAVRAREPTRATLANRPRRWIFTVFKPLHRGGIGAMTRAGGLPDDVKVGSLDDTVARGG